MKTKLIIISGILAILLIAASALAQDARPGRAGRAESPDTAAAQADPLTRPFTPQERAQIRQYLRSRIQQRVPLDRPELQSQPPRRGRGQTVEPQRQPRGPFAGRPDARQWRGLGPQAFAGPGPRFGQGFGPQRGAFAQGRFGGRGPGRMQQPFGGQGRMQQPFGPQTRPGPGAQWNRPAQRQDRPWRDQAERPDVPRRFEERDREQVRGPRFGRQEFEDGSRAAQRPGGQIRQQDRQIQPPRRDFDQSDPDDDDERLGRVRPRLGREAQ